MVSVLWLLSHVVLSNSVSLSRVTNACLKSSGSGFETTILPPPTHSETENDYDKWYENLRLSGVLRTALYITPSFYEIFKAPACTNGSFYVRM